VAFEYVDVKGSPEGLKEMLRWSKGKRDVPVIVDGDKVTIGFGGS
jgi:glutaredoxin